MVFALLLVLVMFYIWFMRKVIADNADRYLDLVPTELRQQFDLPAS